MPEGLNSKNARIWDGHFRRRSSAICLMVSNESPSSAHAGSCASAQTKRAHAKPWACVWEQIELSARTMTTGRAQDAKPYDAGDPNKIAAASVDRFGELNLNRYVLRRALLRRYPRRPVTREPACHADCTISAKPSLGGQRHEVPKRRLNATVCPQRWISRESAFG